MRLPYTPNPPLFEDPAEAAVVDRIAARRAPRPLQPLDLALLHAPPVADGWNAFLGAVRTKTPNISADLRELAVSRVAVVNRAWYEWGHHAPLAAKEGVSEAALDVVKQPEAFLLANAPAAETGLTPTQWAVLVYTDEMTRNVEVADATFSHLRTLFDERQIVELTAVIACYNCAAMLEYMSYKKYRKHKEEKDQEEADAKGKDKGKAAEEKTVAGENAAPNKAKTDAKIDSEGVDGVPVLDRDEQSFLENLTRHWGHEDDDDDIYGADEKPPLPPRMKTPDLTWDSDSESFVRDERLVAVDEQVVGTKTADKHSDNDKASGGSGGIGRRLSTLFKKKDKAAPGKTPGHLAVPGTVDVDAALAADGTQLVVSTAEEDRERAEIARVLEDLDLGSSENDKNEAKDGKDAKDAKEQSKSKRFALTLSAESTELVRRFVLVLKDLVNGVPTAADDLKHLLDDRDGSLARGFEKLPSSMRKLVSQLPSKLTSTLAPELLAAAAESQGVKLAKEVGTEGTEGMDAKAAAKAMFLPLVTKPTAIVKMLKAIMNALKLRWPAFIGTSAIWSVALFLLMFVLWYCHKRGREVRLGKEAGDAAAAETAAESGPALPDGEPAIVVSSGAETLTLPRPPIGPDAPK